MLRTLANREPKVLPRPRQMDPKIVLWGVAGVTGMFWVFGGGLAQFATATGIWLAVGQLAGFAAALAALVGLILVSRPPYLERKVGLDQLWRAHRIAGITTVVALAIHCLATTFGFGNARPGRMWAAFATLLTTKSWMVAALVAVTLFAVVALTSWRRLRTRMNYETWHAIHVTGYLAVLLGFGHQLTVGADLATDTTAHSAMRVWWIGVGLATVALLLCARIVGIWRIVRYGRATVVSNSVVARSTVALELALPSRAAGKSSVGEAGQFFVLRFLTRDLWWQAHPISMSARPVGGRLRFTVRIVGDGSSRMAIVRPGTRVLLAGPYGAFTADRAAGRPVVLIGGGVGLAPLRALLEDCDPRQSPVVVARVTDRASLPHAEEIRRLTAARRGRLIVVAGPSARWQSGKPFHERLLAEAIPDLRDRDVFVCGPPPMERAVERGLRRAGVASDRIHIERFGV